ncbi:ATP-dependent helicase [Cyclobacterium sp. SYSU L10401]|uniref:ATP-dependent helicase n=1 Tax=Cyclobacterium sp. SYSU L10401 TaxID=2678657 RepID=UPI0013D2D724|nr:ATP-dependent helicase [Cyclobacterium sp. SYSU L10401]
MSKSIQLPHVNTLGNIDECVKVFAGPGAGKTRWLIGQLERVLKHSNKLGKTGKIACITYTNVAAEELIDRMKYDRSRFEISTIHSFLYRNIIKPFSYHISRDENGDDLFNIEELNGHDEHKVQDYYYRRWIETLKGNSGKNYNVYYSKDVKSKAYEELASLDYSSKSGKIELITRKNWGAKLPKSNKELWLYKSKYWKDGIMHHEDVLYFSYLIIKKSPRVLEFISSKFPYIYLDEFQDTTELQTWIVNEICDKTSTTIGVVGDLAQSIYSFNGAQRKDFTNFRKGKSKDFGLDKNHRSTISIVNFLNEIRIDLKQQPKSSAVIGDSIKVLVGPIKKAEAYLRKNHPTEEIHVLARSNEDVSKINGSLGKSEADLSKEIFNLDGNSQRSGLIYSILLAFKYKEKGLFSKAIKEISKPIRKKVKGDLPNILIRRIGIDILTDIDSHLTKSTKIFDFYNELKKKTKDEYGFEIGSGLSKGKAKDFYSKFSLNELLPYVKTDTISNDLVRTIHSSKGTEFCNTLVYFPTCKEFTTHILNGQKGIESDNDDSTRIYYVACSRAMNRLFLSIPDTNGLDFILVKKLNLEIVNV